MSVSLWIISVTAFSRRTLLFLCFESCFTSTETIGLLGTGAQDGHLDFHSCFTPFTPFLCLVSVYQPFHLYFIPKTLTTIDLFLWGSFSVLSGICLVGWLVGFSCISAVLMLVVLVGFSCISAVLMSVVSFKWFFNRDFLPQVLLLLLQQYLSFYDWCECVSALGTKKYTCAVSCIIV